MKADCDVNDRDEENWNKVEVPRKAVPYTLPLLFAGVDEKSRFATGALQAHDRSEVKVGDTASY